MCDSDPGALELVAISWPLTLGFRCFVSGGRFPELPLPVAIEGKQGSLSARLVRSPWSCSGVLSQTICFLPPQPRKYTLFVVPDIENIRV